MFILIHKKKGPRDEGDKIFWSLHLIDMWELF